MKLKQSVHTERVKYESKMAVSEENAKTSNGLFSYIVLNKRLKIPNALENGYHLGIICMQRKSKN